MKNLQKGFIVPILIAIIAVLAISGGVYVYRNKKLQTPVVDNEIQQSTNIQPSITLFSPNGGEMFKSTETINVEWNFSNLPGVNQNNPETVENVSITVVDRADKSCTVVSNIPVIAKKYPINVSNKQKCYPLNAGDLKVYLKVGMFDARTVEDYSDNYFTITSNETSNWKTYTNSQYGFTISYPNSFIDKGQTQFTSYLKGPDPDFQTLKLLQMPGTNATTNESIYGNLQISVGATNTARANCLVAPQDVSDTTNVTINNAQFFKYNTSDVGLSNRLVPFQLSFLYTDRYAEKT